MKVISNEKQIKDILEKDPKSRDDDMRLLSLMWYNHIKRTYSDRVLKQCTRTLELISKSGVPHFETVRRTRQEIQADPNNKHLWGSKKKKRHGKEQNEARQSIRDFRKG